MSYKNLPSLPTQDFPLRIVPLFFFLLSCVLWSDEPIPIRVDLPQDYATLDQFFKTTLTFEEYGYVLEGSKPASIRNFASLDQLTMTKDFEDGVKEFTSALLVRDALPIWDRLCCHQKNYALKAVVLKNPKSIAPALEVRFVNLPKLREAIDDSIHLFRYILGATITTGQIVDRIAYSNELLIDILQHNLTLVGIVLGFGPHNSVVGGRIETISALTLSRDIAPFTPRSDLMRSKKNHSLDFVSGSYGSYFLDFAGGGDDSYFRHDIPLLRPSSGFANLEDEVIAIDAMYEPIPPSLWERPRFVFGPFSGGPANQPFIEQLQRAQERIRILLERSDFLEQVLEKIGGIKPIIACDKSNLLSSLNVEEWRRILLSAANQFESKEERSAFISSFLQPTRSSREAPRVFAASKTLLSGLNKAFSNLQEAAAQFKSLSKKASKYKTLHAIVPEQLYFKTTHSGSGKKLDQQDRVRVGYVIEDMEKNVLFANCDTWLRLSQTIPGFAHGMQGMRIGEKRSLFVHPAFGYGAWTTLPPCIGLTIKVHLMDIEEGTSGTLPALIPLALNWVQNREFCRKIEESMQQQPHFAGSFYREILDRVEGVERSSLIAAEFEKLKL